MEITKEWLRQKWIKEGMSLRQLGIDMGLGPRGLEKYAIRYGLRSKYKNSLNEKKFTLKDPVFRYFLGLLYADGYVDKNSPRVYIDLQGEDARELLEKLRQYFEVSTPIGNYKNPKGDRVRYRLTLVSDRLRDLLKNCDLTNRKTDNIRLPALPTYWEFFRGFIDGDGSFSVKRHRLRWYCHSKVFNVEVQKELQMGNIQKHPKGGTVFSLTKLQDLKRLIQLIYNDTYYCYAPKWERAKQILSK